MITSQYGIFPSRKEYNNFWQKKNIESTIASRQKYYAKNKSKLNAASVTWQKSEKGKLYKKLYALKNRKRMLEIGNRWKLNNKNKVRQYREKSRLKNRISARIWDKKQRQQSIEYVLKRRCRGRICAAVKLAGVRKYTRTTALLGCSIQQLKIHIQFLFKPGMSWDNRPLWHIDHKRPCSSFDLADPEQQKLCFNYTNLQPLWANENQSKSDKWTPV
jgi:hypothetical protein